MQIVISKVSDATSKTIPGTADAGTSNLRAPAGGHNKYTRVEPLFGRFVYPKTNGQLGSCSWFGNTNSPVPKHFAKYRHDVPLSAERPKALPRSVINNVAPLSPSVVPTHAPAEVVVRPAPELRHSTRRPIFRFWIGWRSSRLPATGRSFSSTTTRPTARPR